MRYWRGLFIAATLDLVWILGCPPIATEPAVAPTTPVHAVETPSVDARLNELMTHLQEHPEDVDAMRAVARLYAEQGWHDAAIGPLARALQLDPSRRGLWVALDDAVERSGKDEITDAELTRRAARFVEAVERWGHGC